MANIDNGIYDRVANTWWDQDGFMAILRTSVNPSRFEYFERVLRTQLNMDPAGLKVLDVGCGGGLLSEKLAGLGCYVTGIDMSSETIAVAREHAQSMGLEISYLQANAEHLPFAEHEFDVVFCCDLLEHVESVDAVIRGISRVLKPEGAFLFDTINRTFLSKLVAIKIAQDWSLTRFIPRNVHLWEKFIRPNELKKFLIAYDFSATEIRGLSPRFKPLKTILALIACKLGKISFAEFGEKIRMFESNNTAVSYMGFSIKLPLDPKVS